MRLVLKKTMGLSYRTIKRVPFAGNSQRSKVLRSLYAQKMLPIYSSNRRIINVDESWIPVSDFNRQRWRRRGMKNTMADKVLSQKINIITAMSSDGDVWYSLTTCNTDSDVLMCFMSHLARALTKESPGWRDECVFLLDGVSDQLSMASNCMMVKSEQFISDESLLPWYRCSLNSFSLTTYLM